MARQGKNVGRSPSSCSSTNSFASNKKAARRSVPPKSDSSPSKPITSENEKQTELLLRVILRVHRREALPLLRQIFQRKNRRHRAHRHARAAIDAFCGIDKKLLHSLMVRL